VKGVYRGKFANFLGRNVPLSWAACGKAVQFTAIEGAGTRVEVPSTIDAEAFQAVTREAIVAAQQQKASQIP
jgi:hypothetical protein